MTRAAAGGAAPYYSSPSGDVALWQGDARAVLRALPAGSVHAVITSPPFLGLRDYGIPPSEWPAVEYAPLPGLPSLTVPVPAMSCCLGLEPTVEAFVGHLVLVFRALRRVMRDDAAAFLNLGDSYATQPVGTFNGGGPALTGRNLEGHHFKSPVDKSRLAGVKPKDLLEIPSLVVLALRADGWWLRSRIPWIKRNSMPESADDRPSSSTEYVFLLSKASSYFYDCDAVRTPQDTASRSKFLTGDEPPGRYPKRYGLDGRQGALRGKNPERLLNPAGRNRRNGDWWFDSLRAILDGATGLLADEDGEPLALPVNPESFPGAHFATFPRRLVEPMLLASTSARGCCPKCGAPYVRVVERHLVPTPKASKANTYGARDEAGLQALDQGSRRDRDGHIKGLARADVTTGWRAGCACNAGPPISCTVLDPFCGAGTVPLVARKHGRTSWGIDLSAAYLELARERLGQLALPGLVAD